MRLLDGKGFGKLCHQFFGLSLPDPWALKEGRRRERAFHPLKSCATVWPATRLPQASASLICETGVRNARPLIELQGSTVCRRLEVWKVPSSAGHCAFIHIESLFSSRSCSHLCQVTKRISLGRVRAVKEAKPVEGVCVDIHPATALCRRKEKSHTAASRMVLIAPRIGVACRAEFG